MKTSDLMLSRRLVNQNWKSEIFSLPEICNYFRKENGIKENEAELKNFFALVKNVKRESINPEFVRQNCPAGHLVNGEIKKLVKDPKTGKFTISSERREKFSMWYVQGCILNAAAKIQAAAGVRKGTKEPEKDLLKEAAEKEAAAAAVVNANKKRIAAAAAGKKSAAAGKKSAAA